MAKRLLHGQEQSSFFSKLPYEIRTEIYKYALTDRQIHISCRKRVPFVEENKQDNTLVGIPCLSDHEFSLPLKDALDIPNINWGMEHQQCLKEFKRRNQISSRLKTFILSLNRPKTLTPLSMMLTCRLMHFEMESFAYSTIMFSINDGDFEACARFLTSISQEALKSLRRIRIHFCAYWPIYHRPLGMYNSISDPTPEEKKWESIWQTLSKSSNLQDLHVTVFDRGYVIFEDELLEPVRAASAKRFTIQLPWSWGFSSWKYAGLAPDPDYRGVTGEDCNFQIIRPSNRREVVYYRLKDGRRPGGRNPPLR